MARKSSYLQWCVVRLDSNYNWWVIETSDPIHWEVDGLSILDPRQVQHLLELLDALSPYGFKKDIFKAAFSAFKIEKALDKEKVRLSVLEDDLLDSKEPLFLLPKFMGDEGDRYAEFLDHTTRLRTKMLNDLIDFERPLSVDEVEEDIRERQQISYSEGAALHVFQELMDILEYVPEGYELDEIEGEDSEINSTEEDDSEESLKELQEIDFPEEEGDENELKKIEKEEWE